LTHYYYNVMLSKLNVIQELSQKGVVFIILEPKVVGVQVVERIAEIQKIKQISREQIANSLSRSVVSLNKLFYDLKEGKISLENLVRLSGALNEPISELFRAPARNKEGYDMFTKRLLTTTNSMQSGQKFELKEVLTGLWPALEHTERQEFGRRFHRDVMTGNVFPRVQFVRKKGNNHAEYTIV